MCGHGALWTCRGCAMGVPWVCHHGCAMYALHIGYISAMCVEYVLCWRDAKQCHVNTMGVHIIMCMPWTRYGCDMGEPWVRRGFTICMPRVCHGLTVYLAMAGCAAHACTCYECATHTLRMCYLSAMRKVRAKGLPSWGRPWLRNGYSMGVRWMCH